MKDYVVAGATFILCALFFIFVSPLLFIAWLLRGTNK